MTNRLLFHLTAGLLCGSFITIHYTKWSRPTTTNTPWNFDWDKRHTYYQTFAQKHPSNIPFGKRKITLIRHAEYHRIAGDVNDNKQLTQKGKKQAVITGDRLKNSGIKFEYIYCAAFTRAQQTCQIIVDQLPYNSLSDIVYDKELNEGLPTMMEPFQSYRTMESYVNEVKRTSPSIKRAFVKYVHRRNGKDMDPSNENDANTENVLIVGHGNVFRYFLTRALQIDTRSWARFNIFNCGISKINILDDGRVIATHIGDTGHLPNDLLTGAY